MKFDSDDTIAAVASAPGPALRGTVRVSGPDAVKIFSAEFPITAADSSIQIRDWLTNLRRAEFVACRLELEPGCVVDADLLVWPDRRSFTRQPAVEIHTIGSPVLLELILERLIESGCRLAEPGEFTLRAFLSGRIDLTQAEAVLDLIDARDRKQFDRALTRMAGGVGGPIGEIRDQLLGLLAELEAGLDFVEEDIEFISAQSLQTQLERIADALASVTRQILDRQTVGEKLTAVLFGRPNAGKSSLFNRLTGSQAIVSPVSGTTRDYLTTNLNIDGLKIELVDTAGVDSLSPNDLQDCFEGHGGHRAVDELMRRQSGGQIDQADVQILCLESGVALNEFERVLINSANTNLIIALTKTDLVAANLSPPEAIATSSKTGSGMRPLIQRIAAVARTICGVDSATSGTIGRASSALRDASESVSLALEAVAQQRGEEITAAELRLALDHLGRVVGTIYTDDILDQVFSRFCIGK